ncbi:sulfite exporter TauE/SafE family protein [Undibacterium sp. TJN25]|uniref:sulfite exporter TauE/SafE family protein n=1 Tax=Undibacterium sp. TJN25 TaxID=3413056 RepID=UPI003BF2AD61
MDWFFILAVGLVAGTISGIVGFGSSIMLMPVLVIEYGPREAVPIMAVAALMANLSRIMVWWRDIDWRACGVYSITGIPAAALGARTLLVVPPHIIEATLGAFFILMIPARRWLASRQLNLKLWHLAVVGAFIGFLTGIVVSTGPINAPIFLAYGLVKGAFLATEAAGSLGVYLSKALTFRYFGALPGGAILKGLIIGSSLMTGSYFSKRFVLKLEPDFFRLLMDGLMLVSGVAMLWSAR